MLLLMMLPYASMGEILQMRNDLKARICIFSIYIAAMQGYYSRYKTKTKPRTRLTAALICPVKPFEYLGQIIFRNRITRIFDCNDYISWLFCSVILTAPWAGVYLTALSRILAKA